MACFRAPRRPACSGNPGPGSPAAPRPAPPRRLAYGTIGRGWARARRAFFFAPALGAWRPARIVRAGFRQRRVRNPFPGRPVDRPPRSRVPPLGGFFCAIAFSRPAGRPPPAVPRSCGGLPAGHSLLHWFDDHFVASGPGEFFTFCSLQGMLCRFGGLRQGKGWRPRAVGVFWDVMVWRPAGGSATIR